ncbi:hypothetical protein M5X00_17420 [Paenibacillus alvei]|uniref:Transposase n=1 Tax=Paenibacillus alvei TaxID=44250 RepID=A0ABT4GZR2_PAEAL|nr:hypothetical protein [Paenibacillus alvei]EJW19163.1 hypothetical protein PAV_1c01340 [Paenibacillus alvei DSM 29]MCY7486400.1 hypothetical protein [Paenibacillus alvei]MCY9541836.1 hypothetical protein [Paenibacillus alvei]MCY9706328.1 hypothetical protein [Paenibacillus alvei]MCY9732236.1 hypothetical protein [Paenibacillus alvei]
MFILIEIDRKWTVGIDWYKHTKGIRLGFIAFHVCTVKHSYFVNTIARHYAKNMNQEGKQS